MICWHIVTWVHRAKAKPISSTQKVCAGKRNRSELDAGSMACIKLTRWGTTKYHWWKSDFAIMKRCLLIDFFLDLGILVCLNFTLIHMLGVKSWKHCSPPALSFSVRVRSMGRRCLPGDLRVAKGLSKCLRHLVEIVSTVPNLCQHELYIVVDAPNT